VRHANDDAGRGQPIRKIFDLRSGKKSDRLLGHEHLDILQHYAELTITDLKEHAREKPRLRTRELKLATMHPHWPL
jgi:hypothetical protein